MPAQALPAGVVPNSDFRSLFTTDNFIAATVACPAGEATPVWRYTVPDGQCAQLGYSNLRGQENAEGRFYADIEDGADADVTSGYLIVAVENQQGREVETLIEVPLTVARRGATDISQRIPLPVMEPFLRPGRAFVIKFKNTTEASITLSKANSTMEIDLTKHDFNHV